MSTDFSGMSAGAPVTSRSTGLSAAACGSRIAEHASAQEIAEVIHGLWLDLGSALQPVIGVGGVACLFDRSLHLTAARYPWLTSIAPSESDTPIELALLMDFLAEQQPEMAVEAASAMFMNFRDLLATLIGPPLTERLLQSAWTPLSSTLRSRVLPGDIPRDDPVIMQQALGLGEARGDARLEGSFTPA